MLTQEKQWLLNEKYDGQTTDAFFADCKRLEDGEPLAYVIGYIPFLNSTIYLDSHPLIPRPETEFWVAKALDKIENRVIDKVRILDLCAGSGCIGVAIAHAFPKIHVDFAELDENHHPTIEKNLHENKIGTERTRIFGGDLFEQIDDEYDYIFSNPPYIDSELNRVDASVKKYEPHTALYGGKKGLELIKRIIRDVPKHLTAEGILYIEHEPEHTTAIRDLALINGFQVVVHKDQYDLGRYSVLSRT